MMEDHPKMRVLNRRQWCIAVAHFLERFSRLEMSIDEINSAISAISCSRGGPKRLLSAPSASWLHHPLERRIDKLISKLKLLNASTQSDRWASISQQLEQAKAQVAVRNTLSHGFLAADATRHEPGGYVVISRALRNESGDLLQEQKIVRCSDVLKGARNLMDISEHLSKVIRDLLQEGAIFDERPTLSPTTWQQNERLSSLSTALGKFFIEMNFIDMLLFSVYQFVLGITWSTQNHRPKNLSGKYLDSITLAEICADLEAELPREDDFNHLRNVISEISETKLIEERNMLSHARLCYLEQGDGTLALTAARRTRKGVECRSEVEVRTVIALSIKLSDDLSEALACTPRLR